MDCIPTEISHEIFIKLGLKDRKKCLFVCRSWYNILDQRSLLYDLDLDISSRQYRKIMNMVERLPYRGTQNEYLAIDLDSRPDVDKVKLCNIFPNLCEVIFETYSKQKFENYVRRPFYFTISRSRFERIVEYGECELIRQLVMSNLCNNLKKLELNTSHPIKSARSDLITQLKNMPVLEYLVLNRYNVTLMDLKTMHHNLPTIKNLHLDLQLLSGNTPQNVLPASLITKLRVDICTAEDQHTHIQFYRYIYNKYPSVNKPIYKDLKVLYGDTDYVRDVYNEGILPLYQRLGSQTHTFSLGNHCDGLDVFGKFDGFGIKLENLTIETYHGDVVLSLGDLTQSQQSNYIKIFTLKNVVPEPMHLMKNMKVLIHLEIDTSYSHDYLYRRVRKTTDFSQLIEACPTTLTKLVLSALNLTFSEPASNQTCIKCLIFNYIYLDPRLAEAIETRFPQLVQLQFDGEVPTDVTISLPSHNLEVVEIKASSEPPGRIGFVITTTDNNQVEYYGKKTFKDHNGYGNDEVALLPRKEFHYSPVLSLMCASVDDLSLQTQL